MFEASQPVSDNPRRCLDKVRICALRRTIAAILAMRISAKRRAYGRMPAYSCVECMRFRDFKVCYTVVVAKPLARAIKVRRSELRPA